MLKIPQKPPSMREFMEGVSGPDLFEMTRNRSDDSKYRHWNKLRHLAPPEGFDHRQWWFSLKLSRQASAKTVRLQDAEGHSFSYVLTDSIPRWLHEIDLQAGGTLDTAHPIIDQSSKDRYLIRSLVEEAISSSILEGAATTRRVAKEMIREGRKPRDRSERMIFNNFKTMQRIGHLRHEPLTKKLVFEIHRIVTQETLEESSMVGRFRRYDEEINVSDNYGQVFHIPPPAGQLDERMDLFCAFANGEFTGDLVHPAIRSVILHFWLAYDHPFVDGNGRTARALFYWSMLHHGYWLCEFISISEIILKGPSKYGRAFLYTETDDNDLTYFLLYHLEVIRRAFDQLHAYIERKSGEHARLERELKSVQRLNHRQLAIVGHALRHPHQKYTIESHQRSHGVVYQTARTDLLKLAELGLLDSRKVGRTWHFRPSPDMNKRLKDLSGDDA